MYHRTDRILNHLHHLELVIEFNAGGAGFEIAVDFFQKIVVKNER